MKSELFNGLFVSVSLAAFSAFAAELAGATDDAARYESGGDLTAIRRLEVALRESSAQPAERSALEGELVKLLGPGSSYEARLFACQQLAVIGSEAALPALAALLPQPENAGMACLALASYPAGAAGPGEVLRAALPSLSGAARLQVIAALGSRRDAAAVPALLEIVRSPEVPAAVAALGALGKIADRRTQEALFGPLTATPTPAATPALLNEPHPELAGAISEAALRVAEALAAAGDTVTARPAYERLLGSQSGPANSALAAQANSIPAYYRPPHVRRGAWLALLASDRDGGTTRILQTLRGADEDLKPAALNAVRFLKSSSASAEFGLELPRLEARHQVRLIEALAARGDAAARAAITTQVASGQPEVRLSAIAALGRIGDAVSVPLLMKALERASDAEERRAVVQALSNLPGSSQSDQAIIRTAQSAPAKIKPDLLLALARRNSTAAVPLLLAESANADARVAAAAFQGLGQLATVNEFPVLLDKLAALRAPEARADAEAAVAQVISQAPDRSQCSGPLRERLGRARSLEARCSFVRLLPLCGDAPSLEALRAALGDPSPVVQDAGVHAASDWPTLAVWDLLVELHQQGRTETHQTLAWRGLARLIAEENSRPDARLVDRYRQLLAAARNDGERRLVLGALAGVADPGALSLAVEELSRPGVRTEVEQAVRQIAEAIRAQHPQAAAQALDRLKR